MRIKTSSTGAGPDGPPVLDYSIGLPQMTFDDNFGFLFKGLESIDAWDDHDMNGDDYTRQWLHHQATLTLPTLTSNPSSPELNPKSTRGKTTNNSRDDAQKLPINMHTGLLPPSKLTKAVSAPSATTTTTAARRGRPPKVDHGSQDSTKPVSDQPIVPRKRGRPRKVVINPDPESVGSNAPESTDTQVASRSRNSSSSDEVSSVNNHNSSTNSLPSPEPEKIDVTEAETVSQPQRASDSIDESEDKLRSFAKIDISSSSSAPSPSKHQPIHSALFQAVDAEYNVFKTKVRGDSADIDSSTTNVRSLSLIVT